MRKGKGVKHSVTKRLVVGLLSVVLLLTACATTIPSEKSEETENSRVRFRLPGMNTPSLWKRITR